MLGRRCCAVAHAHPAATPACSALVTVAVLSVMLTQSGALARLALSGAACFLVPAALAQPALAVDAARGEQDQGDFTRWNLLQCHHDLLGGAAEAQHVGPQPLTLLHTECRYRMGPECFKLCVAESYIILTANDVAELQLTTAQVIPIRLLRLRLHHLANCSTAQAIHAMLDQELSTSQITLVPYLQQS